MVNRPVGAMMYIRRVYRPPVTIVIFPYICAVMTSAIISACLCANDFAMTTPYAVTATMLC